MTTAAVFDLAGGVGAYASHKQRFSIRQDNLKEAPKSAIEQAPDPKLHILKWDNMISSIPKAIISLQRSENDKSGSISRNRSGFMPPRTLKQQRRQQWRFRCSSPVANKAFSLPVICPTREWKTSEENTNKALDFDHVVLMKPNMIPVSETSKASLFDNYFASLKKLG